MDRGITTYTMDPGQCRLLLKNRLILARTLDLSELLQFLIQENVLNDRMVEKIESKCTSFGKNVAFLSILPSRGPLAYAKFTRGLVETQQEHLATMLDQQEIKEQENSVDKAQKILPFPASSTAKAPLKTMDFHDGPSRVVLEKTTMEFYRANFTKAYKMSSTPRGYALIVNVTEFDEGVDLPQRQGGNIDKENLGTMLHYLGFETLLVENRTADQIRSTVRSFSRRGEHKNRDACIVALLTHGKQGVIFGRDGRELPIEDIVSMFDNANCPNLRNKPKIFFVQACRGDHYDRGIDVIDGRPKGRKRACEVSSRHCDFESRLPTRSDMIFGYATQSGQAAMRNTHHGSWYIEALVKVLARHARNQDLAEMLTSVNSVIKGMQGHSPSTDMHNCKEMPIFHSTLCKKLYFFPGISQSTR